MKLETHGKIINANFGCKFGNSIYLVSERFSATSLDLIIGYFTSSTIESAIKRVVEDGYLDNRKEIYLITGDGQEVCLTVDDIK